MMMQGLEVLTASDEDEKIMVGCGVVKMTKMAAPKLKGALIVYLPL